MHREISALVRRMKNIDSASHRDLRAWFRTLGEFGLFEMTLPEVYGGTAMGAVAAVSALEALGRCGVEGGVAFSIGAHLWAVMMGICECGTPTQKSEWLPKLASGECIGAIALSEANAGSDLFSMNTRVVLEGDHYVIEGRKAWCTNAPLADVFIVFARTGNQGSFPRCAAFLIERNVPGLSIEAPVHKLGLEESPMADVVLDRCRIPKSALLGGWGQGSQVFHEALVWERGALSAPFVGAMQRQLEACVAYACERRQFGKPIGSFQAISHRIAEMKLRLETARLLLYRFASIKDAGGGAEVEASLVKWHVSESYVKSSLDAIQIHGANGYARELGVEAALRDAMGLRIASGTNEIQQSAISRALGV
jgi:alkylation response protein AidB-like acyl-CoA dehydrogenase